MGIDRRTFIGNTSKLLAGAGTAALMPGSSFSILNSRSPNEEVIVGVIGCNGMGWSNLSVFLEQEGVTCSVLCDVDRDVLEKRASDVEERAGNRPTLFGDYRKMLEQKDIDAVIIATPDHWHCLPMVHACQAGKDIYVEKPLGRTIAECQIMAEAARKYNRVVQVGQWQRSGKHWQEAIDFLHSGKLGTIRLTKAWAYMGWMDPVPARPNEPAPEGVDYDMWLGPAPERPFNPNRFHFDWRWYWDYAGGLMTDWGVHLIDIVLYGMDVRAPNSVMSTGGKYGYPDSGMETPDTQQAIYEFDDFSMIWEHGVGINEGPYGRDHGVAFIGNNGTLVIDRGKWEVIPEVSNEEYLVEPVPVQEGDGQDLANHVQNFLECIKTREKPACDVAEASNTAINASLGNIAFLTGDKVSWNGEKSRFKNNKEADRYIRPEYRAPWKLPDFQM